MAETTELTVQQREVIFEDMDKVTQKAAQDGLKKLQAGYQVAVLIQYDLGEIVNRIFDAEHLNETQQKQEIKKLAAYWNQSNLNSSTLYDLRNVAASFDREFVKAQVEERMANGNYLSWSHFKELQKVDSETKQLAILKKIRQHSWSANELALELQGKKEAAIKRSGGRKPMLPKTPNAMLQKLFTTVQQADNYVTALSEPLDGIFLELSSSDVDDQFVENLNNTLERISEASEHFSETEKRLKKVLKRASKVLEESDEATDDEEETTAPKRRGRPPKIKADGDTDEEVPAPKRRGRPPKVKAEEAAGVSISVAAKASEPSSEMSQSGVKRRGRPRRAEVVAVNATIDTEAEDEGDDE